MAQFLALKVYPKGTDFHAWEDLTQDVLAHLWAKRNHYQPGAKYTTWAYVVGNRLVIDQYRSQKRHPAAGTLNEDDRMTEDDDADLRVDLVRAIALLPPKERLVIEYQLADRPLSETGLSNPRQYRAQAYTKLRDLLADGHA